MHILIYGYPICSSGSAAHWLCGLVKVLWASVSSSVKYNGGSLNVTYDFHLLDRLQIRTCEDMSFVLTKHQAENIDLI